MANPKTRNISTENLKEIFDFIENFQIKNKSDERDLIILKYAYINNLSAESIYKLNDPRLIGYSNNNYGNKISAKSIRFIIRSYHLEKNKRVDYSIRNNYRKRNELLKTIKGNKMQKPRICACCGEKNNLELHHIIPLSLGGTNEYFNLIYLCHECHYQMHKMMKSNIAIYNDKCKNNK